MAHPYARPSPRIRIRPWILVSAAWIIPACLGGLNVIAQGRLRGAPLNIRAALFTVSDWLLYGAITPIVFILSHRFPLSRPHLRRHIVFHFAAALVFCAAWAGMGTVFKAIIQPDAFGEGVRMFFVSWLFTTLPFGVAVYLAVVGVEHAARYFFEARESEAQVARLSEQLTGARLAALQAQLNPHFLFNSLNTIAVLVRDGERATATRVIEKLSGLLRRTLSWRREHEVQLDEELDLVREYLAVEQARFSDRLRAEYDIDGRAREALVPSFALQHLVANAVRHGIAERSDAGRIVVTARRDGDVLELSVADDGPGIALGADAASGHGLTTTRERLAAVYGNRATLEVARLLQGTLARIRLPFRTFLDTPAGAQEADVSDG